MNKLGPASFKNTAFVACDITKQIENYSKLKQLIKIDGSQLT